MTTLTSRIRAILEANPPGTWFDVEDHEMKNVHRLQIAVHQAAAPDKKCITRNDNGTLRVCYFEKETE